MCVETLLVGVALVAAVAVLTVLWRLRGQRMRRRGLREVMDAADALEAHVRAVRDTVNRTPGGAAADSALQEVMRDLLRNRLWLQQQGLDAPLAELESVRAKLETARLRLGGRPPR